MKARATESGLLDPFMCEGALAGRDLAPVRVVRRREVAWPEWADARTVAGLAKTLLAVGG